MLAGMFGQVLGNAAMARSSTVTQLLLARLVCGLGMSTGPVEMAYIMDFCHGGEDEFNYVLSLQKILTSIGSIAGPLMALFFKDISFPVLCTGLIVLSFLNACLGMLLWDSHIPKVGEEADGDATDDRIEEDEHEDSDGEEHEKAAASFKTLLTTEATLKILLCSMVNVFAYNIVDARNPAFFKTYFGFDARTMSLYMTISTLAALIVAPAAPKIMERLHGEGIAIAGCVVSAVVIFIPGVWVHFGMPMLFWLPYLMSVGMVGVGSCFIGFGFMNCAKRKTESSMLGSLLGLNNSLGSAAGTFAPLLGGLIYSYDNLLPYVLSPVFFILLAVVYKSLPPDAAPAETLIHKPIAKLRQAAWAVAAFNNASRHRSSSSAFSEALLANAHHREHAIGHLTSMREIRIPGGGKRGDGLQQGMSKVRTLPALRGLRTMSSLSLLSEEESRSRAESNREIGTEGRSGTFG